MDGCSNSHKHGANNHGRHEQIWEYKKKTEKLSNCAIMGVGGELAFETWEEKNGKEAEEERTRGKQVNRRMWKTRATAIIDGILSFKSQPNFKKNGEREREREGEPKTWRKIPG